MARFAAMQDVEKVRTLKAAIYLTFSICPVSKYVAPIHDLIVPNGCSMVCPRMRSMSLE
jgi:hypothetical protein